MTLDELKNKYASVLQTIQDKGVVLSHINMDGKKLFVQGAAPSEAIKNEVWDKVKAVDAIYADLNLHLSVDTSLPQPQAAAAGCRRWGKNLHREVRRYAFEDRQGILRQCQRIQQDL